MRRYVVRAYFLSEGGELLCADTRPLWHRTAHRLAARLKQADHEALDAEVLPWKHNCVRPPPEGIRRVADIASMPAVMSSPRLHREGDSETLDDARQSTFLHSGGIVAEPSTVKPSRCRFSPE